ncbi:MAG: alpha-amylase family protein [Actinomycetales bacterium]
MAANDFAADPRVEEDLPEVPQLAAVRRRADDVRDLAGALERRALDEDLRAELAARISLVGGALIEALELVYGPATAPQLAGRLVDVAVDSALERSPELRRLDRAREIDPHWFQSERMIGYVTYVDRFAGRLDGIPRHLDYLQELGVTYLHLMPLLKAREGENDGGYAVADYSQVEPRLGDMADLESLAGTLHERDMSLCIDLVLNHTAREHAWAQAAMAGDQRYRRFYFAFPDRTMPDAYERTLWEVFPDTAPGSFTYVEEMGGWVWTTFHDYQWDLDWSNPEVFTAMLETILELANGGVDVFRLDAVPFLWKRLGTDCQNQPEAHAILEALRALVRIAAPAVIFKAEAIVPPDQLVQYLGAHEQVRDECDLAYNNQLMVMLWSTLATRDVRLMRHAMSRLRPEPSDTSWVTYVRCHDDIGWAVSDEDAWALGLDPRAHRKFLVDFYAGRFPGSFALGAPFQENPLTGDARTSGTAAALTGVELGLREDQPVEVRAGLRRIAMLYAVAYSYGGIPLLYMGDELALRNDTSYLQDPELAEDNRWMHRPFMDWDIAERRSDSRTPEGQLFRELVELGRARAASPALRGGGSTTWVDTGDSRVLAYVRRHPRSGPLVVLANVGDDETWVPAWVWQEAPIADPHVVASADGPVLTAAGILLPAQGWAWIS